MSRSDVAGPWERALWRALESATDIAIFAAWRSHNLQRLRRTQWLRRASSSTETQIRVSWPRTATRQAERDGVIPEARAYRNDNGIPTG